MGTSSERGNDIANFPQGKVVTLTNTGDEIRFTLNGCFEGQEFSPTFVVEDGTLSALEVEACHRGERGVFILDYRERPDGLYQVLEMEMIDPE